MVVTTRVVRADVAAGRARSPADGCKRIESLSGPAALIDFDLNGRKVALNEHVVRELHERARARAGSSSTLNDPAVILARALAEQKPVTLRRAESRALERLLEQPC